MIRRDDAAVDDVHLDRFLEEQAEVEKRHRETAGSVGEQRVVHAEADLAPFLVVDLLQHLRRRPRRRRIGAMRAFARMRLEQIVGERLGLVELQTVAGGAKASPTTRTLRRKRRRP